MSEPQPVSSNAPVAEPDHVTVTTESHDTHVTAAAPVNTPSLGGMATGEGQSASLIPSVTAQAEVSILLTSVCQ